MGRKKKEPACNRDCFNCQFEDCILEEGPNIAEYRELALIDKSLFETPEKRKSAAYQRAYREANREKVLARQRAYREANHERVAASHKVYYEANREKVLAYQKAYYEANREKVAAYRRAARAKKKAEAERG